VKRAGELHKPALYVAPPQVWAWKKKRAAELAKNPFAKLAVFFDFEEAVYHEAGCNVVRVRHPFVDVRNENGRSNAAIQVLLLPGSRKAQALRNLPLYLNAVRNDENVVLGAARQDLVAAFERVLRRMGGDSLLRRVQIKVAPSSAEERMAFYRSAENVITAPGTATLELALSGTPFTVCTKPDLLTYCLGRLFIKTKFFALPNIILDRLVFPEYIVHPWSGVKTWSLTKGKRENVVKELFEKLTVGKTLDQLALEFLGQFVECKPQ
jgi:lipid-A-disaccharide synthase